MKHYKFILMVVFTLVLSISAGFILLVFAYQLPTKEMKKNIARSSALFDFEGIYPQWATGYKSTQLDNWTDAMLLAAAIHPNTGNTVSDAMNNLRIEYKNEQLTMSLTLWANECEGTMESVPYGRYWHGSLIFIKPLLLFFDVPDVRIFNMIIQTALFLVIMLKLAERGLKKYLPAFFASFMIINPVTVMMSFCFSAEYYLLLLILIFMLYFHEILMKGKRYEFLFLISGIMTVYFNELSFPLVTLAFPLVLYLLLSKAAQDKMIRKEILFSVLWAVGYSIMWLGKWILAWIFTGYNYLQEAFMQSQKYVTKAALDEDIDPSVWDRIMKNIMVIGRWPFLIMFLIIITGIIVYIIKKKSVSVKVSVQKYACLVMIALLPFSWYVCLGNGYSYNHYWFTYRLLSITALAGVVLLVDFVSCVSYKRKKAADFE